MEKSSNPCELKAEPVTVSYNLGKKDCGEIIVSAVKSHGTVCRASQKVNKMLFFLKSGVENKTECWQHFATVLKLSTIHLSELGDCGPHFLRTLWRQKKAEKIIKWK